MRRTVLTLLVAVGLVAGLAPASNAITVRRTTRVGRAAVDVASAPDGSVYVVEHRSTLDHGRGDPPQVRRAGQPPVVAALAAVPAREHACGRGRDRRERNDLHARDRARTVRGRRMVRPRVRTRRRTAVEVRDPRVGNVRPCRGRLRHRRARRPGRGVGHVVRMLQRHVPRRMGAVVQRVAAAPLARQRGAAGPDAAQLVRHRDRCLDRDSGGIYASGWAATRGGITETTPTPGTPILEKLTNNGGRVWSRRASVSMPTMFLPVSVATGGNGVVIAAGIKGKGAGWGQSPTTGWVARYSTAGSPGWQRAFGGGTDTAAEPTGVAISFTGLLWVIGTQRDATDHGTDVFVRTYAPNGNAGRQAPDRRGEATAHVGRDR